MSGATPEQCPHCGSNDIEPVLRARWLRWVPLLFVLVAVGPLQRPLRLLVLTGRWDPYASWDLVWPALYALLGCGFWAWIGSRGRRCRQCGKDLIPGKSHPDA
jgi:hypothetical protein